jgi:death-on-curing protein
MILFVPKDVVIAIHDEQIRLYGGASGVLNPAALDAAIHMPEQTHGGEYLHSTIYEMAAAYAYYLVLDHAFVEGNKRTARMTMVTFLELNGLEITVSEDETLEVMMSIENKTMNKQQVAEWLENVTVLRRNVKDH